MRHISFTLVILFVCLHQGFSQDATQQARRLDRQDAKVWERNGRGRDQGYEPMMDGSRDQDMMDGSKGQDMMDGSKGQDMMDGSRDQNMMHRHRDPIVAVGATDEDAVKKDGVRLAPEDTEEDAATRVVPAGDNEEEDQPEGQQADEHEEDKDKEHEDEEHEDEEHEDEEHEDEEHGDEEHEDEEHEDEEHKDEDDKSAEHKAEHEGERETEHEASEGAHTGADDNDDHDRHDGHHHPDHHRHDDHDDDHHHDDHHHDHHDGDHHDDDGHDDDNHDDRDDDKGHDVDAKEAAETKTTEKEEDDEQTDADDLADKQVLNQIPKFDLSASLNRWKQVDDEDDHDKDDEDDRTHTNWWARCRNWWQHARQGDMMTDADSADDRSAWTEDSMDDMMRRHQGEMSRQFGERDPPHSHGHCFFWLAVVVSSTVLLAVHAVRRWRKRAGERPQLELNGYSVVSTTDDSPEVHALLAKVERAADHVDPESGMGLDTKQALLKAEYPK